MADEQRRLLQATDDIASLVSTDPTLKSGEMLFEEDSGQLKVGEEATWDSTGYFNPANLKEVVISGGTTVLQIGAAHVGSLLHVRGSQNLNILLSAQDLTAYSGPKGSDGLPLDPNQTHFPVGGYFYLQGDVDISPGPTIFLISGIYTTLSVTDGGILSSRVAIHSLNSGNTCAGKLYLFVLGDKAGNWYVYEKDLLTLFQRSQGIVLDYTPAYGGLYTDSPVTYGSYFGGYLPNFTSEFPDSSGMQALYLDFFGVSQPYALRVTEEGVYRITAILVLRAPLSLSQPTLRINIVDNQYPLAGNEIMQLRNPTGVDFPDLLTLRLDGLYNVSAQATVQMQIFQADIGVPVLTVDNARLIIQKHDVAQTFREGSIYNGIKEAINTAWRSEKMATGANAVRVSEATNSIFIGWGTTPEAAETQAQELLLTGQTEVYVIGFGMYVAWKAQSGTQTFRLEQSVYK